MKTRLLFLTLLLCTALSLAETLQPTKLLDAKLGPEQVHQQLAQSDPEAKLLMFHKTGVPYIKSRLQHIGDTWKTLVYFDEKDRPNRVLLSLEGLSASQCQRFQKLAIAEYGPDYRVDHRQDESRREILFIWALPQAKVTLTCATYKKGNRAAWLSCDAIDQP